MLENIKICKNKKNSMFNEKEIKKKYDCNSNII